MASRLKGRANFLSPFVSEKYVNRIAKRLRELSIPLLESGDFTKETSADTPQLTASHIDSKELFKKDPAIIDIPSIYKTLPNAHTTLEKSKPIPRYLWKETDNGFPPSPEEAGVDIKTFLEQRDCHDRLQQLKVPEFCVGSTVAVTRADNYVPKGHVRFVGICIAMNHWQNTLGATFTLRNVIDGEPMEVNFQLYSPVIQKIEVLKHERRDKQALWYLRDYPPALSYVSETMKALPYKKDPHLYVQSKEEGQRVEKWFEQIKKSKRRR
ncbi:39S ribosomal protein L19, mitochondrial [Nematostella vectensis]|uniref:39S ribosomal protein L19, mitochondrial n=1 Tax=Nematostella vectensis TaxID=45351 RepID=UPI002077870A|nr:39S ribosomal protein L19, mitochondrial [Nematostella vectensis]